jgi:alpha-glucosidase
MLVLWLLGCGADRTLTEGSWELTLNGDGSIDVAHASLPVHVDGLRFLAGTASADVEMRFGAFAFTDVAVDDTAAARHGAVHQRVQPTSIDLEDADGQRLGTVLVSGFDDGVLLLTFEPVGDTTLVGLEAACDADEHALGLGGHAFDVDHVGEAFPLWVSEPGIGKSDTDVLPDAWYLEGTRHATSYPVPFVLRPQQSSGIVLDTTGRVDVDLCSTDPGKMRLAAWQSGGLGVAILAGSKPLDVIRGLSSLTGRAPLPPKWVFAPWNDAIRGSARVRTVAAELREAGAPSSVIWTEDWKGGEDGAQGYHLGNEWFVDRDLYPDVEDLASELHTDGFQWLAYFAPFVEEGTATWDAAIAADALIHDPAGDPYTFSGAMLTPNSMVDLTNPDGRALAEGYMTDALDLGFDGWMADFAEWLPPDAALADGSDGWEAHNAWPLLWQSTNDEALGDADAAIFVRSGWTGSASLAPIVWAGDQRTDFEPDDGFPSVMALGIGLATCGVPYFTHDVAGYQSIGNPPSTKELWFRWAELGAFTPVMRTHHGAFDTANWQFDSDPETLAHWARYAREHVRLFPYLYGNAAIAAADGTPLIRAVGVQFPGEDPARIDAWMLGDALLVAPVLEEGATSRDIALPTAVGWYDWWTREPAASGPYDAPLDAIPVFAASGTIVPTLRDIPETLVEGSDAVDLADVDGARIVYVFGGDGAFTEADGTAYVAEGVATGSADGSTSGARGALDLAGMHITVDGPAAREYEFVVVGP